MIYNYYKNSMKKINEYSRLAIIFTVISVILGITMYLASETFLDSIRQTLNLRFAGFSLGTSFIYLLCTITAIVTGVVAIVRTYQTKEKELWVISFVTIFNMLILTLVLVAAVNSLTTNSGANALFQRELPHEA